MMKITINKATKTHHLTATQLTTQHGFTMVELMVAIVLALLLAIVAGQSYLSTKTTYRATEQNARIQENLRFATHFVNREIRQAGNMGCFQTITSHLRRPNNNLGNHTIARLYDLSQPVNVWRWAGSGMVNNFDLSSALAYNTPNANRGRWRDAANRIRPAPLNLNGRVMQGNDIILVTKISESLGIRLNDANTRNNNQLTIDDLNGITIPRGQALVVGDCNKADLFVHTAAPQAGVGGILTRGNGGPLTIGNRVAAGSVWQKNWDSTAEVRFIESTLYFIGTGASGLPALFKLDIGTGLGTAAAATAPLEIVDGIEFMKAVVGTDTNGDNVFDKFLRIDQIGGVANMNNIRNIQVGMLAVGDQNTSIAEANARQFQITQRHRVTSPANDPNNAAVTDTRYRQATTTTVQLRNTGLNRSLEFLDF